jgi:hypothetical protein
MEPEILQGLQRAADKFREDYKAGIARGLQIVGIAPEPITLDVSPDGVNVRGNPIWVARIACGDRVFLNGEVDAEAFLSNLYVVLVYVARALRTPVEKDVRAAAN